MHDVTSRFHRMQDRLEPEDYNFRHFRTTHLISDAKRSLSSGGIQPGTLAPDFELTDDRGRAVRLRGLRGKPVLLHFGSYT